MKTLHPKLRFPAHQIPEIAARYEHSISEDELLALKPGIQESGYLKKSELAKLPYWKAPRSSRYINRNSEEYVEEVTNFAFRAKTEGARVELLRVLNYVSWRTASVILHFFHKDQYPIIDYRALWSVSLDVPSQYTFDFWMVYVNFCRQLANENGVDMRTLDRALGNTLKRINNSIQPIFRRPIRPVRMTSIYRHKHFKIPYKESFRQFDKWGCTSS